LSGHNAAFGLRGVAPEEQDSDEPLMPNAKIGLKTSDATKERQRLFGGSGLN
jgi:hypothetical protein